MRIFFSHSSTFSFGAVSHSNPELVRPKLFELQWPHLYGICMGSRDLNPSSLDFAASSLTTEPSSQPDLVCF